MSFDSNVYKEFNNITNDCAYFDYAATTFMPDRVMEKWIDYEKNVGIYYDKGNNFLSKRAADKLLESEEILHNHFEVSDDYKMIYGKNTTEVANIIALGLSNYVKPLDYILVGPYEHHSNMLSWKYLAKRNGAIFMEMPLNKEGNIDFDYLNKIKDKVKIVSFSSVSNTNAYEIDVNRICEIFTDSLIFIDESQMVAHEKIVVNDNVSGYMLTSHKMYGPKNICGAFVKNSVVEMLEPTLLGGGMVKNVAFNDTWKAEQHKFEAGTMDIGLISAWAEACKFIDDVGYDYIKEVENICSERIKDVLVAKNNVKIVSNDSVKSLISFVSSGMHAHDLEYYLAQNKVIIRSGNLCAQPAIRKLGEVAINRISFGLGVKENDLNLLCDLLKEV